MRRLTALSWSLAALVYCASAEETRSQATGAVHVARGRIPPIDPVTGDAYETWSLFLICNPAWLDQREEARVLRLYDQFRLFGEVIGRRHLAVWFAGPDPLEFLTESLPALLLSPPPITKNPDLREPHEEEAEDFEEKLGRQEERTQAEQTRFSVERLDVSRNVDFCQKYSLLPSESPHIIVTTKDPNLEKAVGDFWKLSFVGQSDRSIRTLLIKLADQILVQGLDQNALGTEQWWRSWYSILDNTIEKTKNIVSDITVTIRTANFSIEARYDQRP